MKISTAYIISGIITGLILLFQFITAIPDGSLRLSVCDVGQGDALYIRLPDGRDMLIDGGPSDKVLSCLGSLMPFYDRTIDLVVLTHPDSDHLTGLVFVLKRYRVGHIVRSDIAGSGETYAAFVRLVARKGIGQKFVTAGETIDAGGVQFRVLWPSRERVADSNRSRTDALAISGKQADVLGEQSVSDETNDTSVVLHLSYGKFDALLTGDAGMEVEPIQRAVKPKDGIVEVYKVPHHGSKTGVSSGFLNHLGGKGGDRYALISVGKNRFGHPAETVLTMLQSAGFSVHRTDREGMIIVVSDGNRITTSSERVHGK